MLKIEQKISILRETLRDCVLTPAERQTIWSEIDQLEAQRLLAEIAQLEAKAS
jgi:hypothetical protein